MNIYPDFDEEEWMRISPKTCPPCGVRQYTCRNCPTLAGMLRVGDEDQAWFARHPTRPTRIRRWVAEEQLNYFLNSGFVPGEFVEVIRTGWWMTDKYGRPEWEGLNHKDIA